MSRSPNVPRAKRSARSVRLLALCSLLLALGALTLLARSRVANSAGIGDQRTEVSSLSSLSTHHSSRSNLYSWLGDSSDIFRKILGTRYKSALTPSVTPFVSPTLVINEIDYDQVGTDTAEFIELKNISGGSVNLDIYNIELVNGAAAPAIYDTINLPNVNLAAGDYYVICANAATVINCDLDDGPDTNFIENGSPDAVGLRNTSTGTLFDAVSYEGDTLPLYTEGAGTPVVTGSDSNTVANIGLSRFPDGLDTDNNSTDVTLRCITPGYVNASNSSGCPAVPATYTWAPILPGTDDSYQNAANWNPDRLLTSPSDVLVVDSTTPTTTINNIPTQTIAQFRVNGATVTLSSAAANTLTIAGAAGTDFDVAASSQVKLSGTTQLTILIGAGATGNIDNLLSFEGTGGSRLIAADTGAVTFPTATNCTALAGYAGNPFGTNAAGAGAGSIVFQSGSTYTHQAGDSPFGATLDSQIVNFASGSTARWFTTTGFQASNRIYANLEIGNGTTAVAVSDSGNGNFQFDDLTVKAAGATNSTLTYTGNVSAAVTIGGNISSTGAGTGTLQDITLVAPGGITINKPASSITFGNDGSNARALNLDGNVSLTNTTTLTLSRIVLLGQVNPNSKTFTVSPTATLNGSATGYVIGGLKKNFTGVNLSRTFEIGTATAYTPVNLSFAAVSVSGDVTANTFSGDHADTTADTSGINKNRSVNEYWNLTKDGSIAFSTYDATFNFTAGLIDGGANTANFIVRKKDAGVWASPSVGTKTATSTQATGMAAMSDFAVGEALIPCVPPATVYVDDNFAGLSPGDDPSGPATNFGCDSFATIQGGVSGVASGGTVNVDAGTYIENVTIAQPLTLTGASAASVFLIPAISSPNSCAGASLCPGGSNLILVQADNVTISGLTLDGDNPSLTSVENFGGANIDARNGIITNHLAGVFQNLEVHHATVKNIYLRGMYASSGGSFNFHDNTVQNVQASAASIGMFNFLGAGAFTNNNVSACNDAIASNHSRGTTYTGNTVTTSASAIHSDNAGDSGGTIDTISGNTVTNSTTFGYGIWVFVPYKTVHVTNNTVTNVDVGYAVFGDSGVTTSSKPSAPGEGHTPGRTAPRSGNVTEPVHVGIQLITFSPVPAPLAPPTAPFAAVFTGNTADGQNKANSTGVYFTTSQIGFGSGSPKIEFTSNTVVNNVDGFYLESETGFNLETAASFNRIVSNTNSQVTQASGGGFTGTLNGSMENNWWGCNAGPNNAGCGTVVGAGVDFDPWIVLGVSASPNPTTPGGMSTVTADMTHNSANAVPSLTTFVPQVAANFTATNGTILPTPVTVTSGQAQSTFTSTGTSAGSACATVDNEEECTTINLTLPSFTIDDVTMAEGNGGPGSTSFTFTITKNGATGFSTTVDYETVNGTATAPSDFTALPLTTLTFLSSDTTKQVTVFVNGDAAVEPDQAFTLHLSNASGATIADADGTGTIQNDDTCTPPATVYVDDSWVGTTPGTDPDAGASPAANFGCDSFATIQDGENGVAPGGTVVVNAGTYIEDVVIDNAGSVLGAGAGTTTISGAKNGPGTTVQILANNVTVAGFTITREGNTAADWNNANGTLNNAGLAIQGLSITGALIRDNIITGNRTGIDINNSGGHTIRNNTIDFNRTGLIFRNQTDNLTVVENFIRNNWTVGVLFLDGSGGTNTPPQQALNSPFSNNDISANWYGQIVDRQAGGSIPAPGTTNLKNFSGNWFGTNAPVVTTANSTEPGYDVQIPVAYGGGAAPPGGQPDIAGAASANFDYTPYLDLGTDMNVETTPGRGTNGFQGNFSVLHVIATGAQTGLVGRIQEGINLAVGSTVNVHAGNYDEDVLINKNNLQLLGAGASSTNIRGPIGGSGATVQIAANTVTVAGFTITRLGNNTTDWNNPGLNSVGLAIQGTSITGALIRDNTFTGNRTGVDINNSNGHTVRNNTIDFNRTGMIFRNQTDNMTVIENFIRDNWTVGVLFLDASGGVNSPVQQALNSTFSNNSISANWYGQIVDRQTGGSLPPPGSNLKNFSSNWYGTNAPVVTTANSAEPGYAGQIPVAYGGSATPPGGQPDIAGPASANFDYTPYLDVGTDTSATGGFQGSFSVLHVVATSAQTGAVGRIQEGINSVTSGGTLHIHTGTYTENVDATANSVVLAPGASPGQVIINGNFTLNGDDTVAIEINGPNAGTDYDQFVVSGIVTLGGATLNLSGTYTPLLTDVFTIINNTGGSAVNGTFAGLPEGTHTNVNGTQKRVTYVGFNGNDVDLAALTADLTVTKTDSQDPVTEGNSFTYTLVVANAGPDPATNVVLTDTLPGGVTFISSTSSQGSCSGTGTVTCNLGTISSGGNATVQIVVTANSPGPLTNNASAVATEVDATPASDSENTLVIAATCTSPAAGMVGWWPGDGNALDIQGPTFENGTLNGATFDAGKVGTAFKFDGVDDYVSQDLPANVKSQTITMDAWVNLNTLTGDPTYGQIIVAAEPSGTNTSGRGAILQIGTTGIPRFTKGSGAGYQAVNATTTLTPGYWYHIAGTYDGATMRIYVNGVQEGSLADAGGIEWNDAGQFPSPAQLYFGAFKDSVGGAPTVPEHGFLNGRADEIEIFNTTLSGPDIANIYNGSFAGKCRTCTAPPSGVVAWYAGEGNATSLTGTNNGTANGTVTFVPGKVGQGFQTNGGFVRVTNALSLRPATAVTVDAWVKGTAADVDDADYIVSKSLTSGVSSYALYSRPGDGIAFYVKPTTGAQVESPIATGIWDGNFHHVLGTYDGSFVRLYVDGVEVGSGTAATGPIQYGTTHASGDLLIGDLDPTPGDPSNFNGVIDEVEIFNRALSASEAALLANAGNAGKCHTSTVQFSSATYNVAENVGGGNATITVTRTGATDSSVNVNYTTVVAGSTATAGTCGNPGVDYVATSGTLTFAANDASETFTIPICNDTTYEAVETVNLELNTPTGSASLGPQSTAVLNISNLEDQPVLTIDDVTMAEGNSGTTNFVFTVTKTGATELTATVNYATADGFINAATGGPDCTASDYISTSGSLSFGPLETTKTITVPVCGDPTIEADEIFFVNLSGGADRTLGDATGDGIILNDESEITLAVSPASVFEDSAPNLVYTFTRTFTNGALTVNFSVGGSATFGPNPGDDYTQTGAATFTPPTGTVTFADGSATATVNVNPTPDLTQEPNETVVLTIAPGIGYTIGASDTATGTITDDDAPSTVIVVRETNLHGWVRQVSSTATTAFVVGPGTPPLGEGSGELAVGSDGNSGAQFRQTGFNGTLLSDLTRLRYSSYTSNDGTAPMTGDQSIYIILNVDLDGDGDFDGSDTLLFFEPEYQHGYTGVVPDQGDNVLNTWQTWDALNGGWWSTTGAAGANPGADVKPLSTIIAAFPNARIHNHATTGSLRLVAGFGAGAWDNYVGNVDDVNVGVSNVNTQYDFEPLPRISITDVTQSEGTPDFTFTVSLSRDSDQVVTVNYATADSSAVAPGDYAAVNPAQTLTFDPGDTSAQVTITVNDDNVFEAAEQFFVNLSAPLNAVILDNQGVGTITDNDPMPTITINNVTQAEGNSGTTAFSFTVSLSHPSGTNVTVDYDTVPGAINPATEGPCGGGNDYQSASGTATVTAGTTSTPVVVSVCGETLVEPDETFDVNLSNNSANSIMAPGTKGIGTITDDDLLIVDDDLVQCPNAGFTTIQAAINAAAAGQTIQVCAGLYTENVDVNKALNLVGPNATINPNTGIRVAEAVVVPATSDPLNGSFAGPIVVNLSVSGSTFKGFTVDGDNPASTSGVIFNGADVDAEFGIYGTETANPDSVIENNIVKNIGEIAVWLNSNSQGGAKNANSRITNNKVDNVLGAFGQALRISDDAWLDVTNNVVTRSRVGIVIENYSGNTTTHPASVIENNTVTTFRIGIRHNLHYVYSAPGFTIRNNTVQSYVQTPIPSPLTTPTTYEGIRVESIQQLVEVDVTTNTVDGNRTALQGAGYTRVEGLEVTNASATSPNIRFTGNRVTDSIRGVFHETPAVPTFTCNNIVGNTTGVELSANATNGLIANNNNIFGNGVGMLNNSPAATVNAENNYWGSATGPTIASNPGGTGDSITGTNAAAVDYNPFLTSGASCAPPAPPTISKAFGAASVALNGTTTLSFTITNPNASTLTAIGFTDTLPAGLIVATPNGLSGGCGGGTITAADGSGSISLSGATLPGGGSCTFSVNVQGTTAGIKNNTSDAVSSSEGGTGGTASATLVVAPPTITIDDVTQAEGNAGTTLFTFTVSLSNSFPSNVTVDYTTVPGITNPATEGTCGGTDDYQDASGTATIPANNLSTTIVVTVCGDVTLEPNETFFVNLSNNSAHSQMAAGTKGTGTITNDDALCGNSTIEPGEGCDDGNLNNGDGCSAICQVENLVTVTVSPGAVSEDGATNLVYTFSRTVASGPQTINFSVSASATLNTDYTVSGADTFTPVSGTVTFTGTNPTATVTLDPSPDTTPELDETVQLTVTAGGGYIVGSPNSATGIITNDDESSAAGQLIISEFRLSGPGANPAEQANNEFIELYNATDQDVFVTTTDGSTGWAVATSSGVAVFFVPNGITIPARGHFLGTNTSGYSLNTYPAGDGTFATGDATWTTDVPDNTGLALFRTNTPANFNTTNRLDSVGPNTEPNTLYREGAGYSPLVAGGSRAESRTHLLPSDLRVPGWLPDAGPSARHERQCG